MKIHVQQIPAEGKHYEGKEDRDILQLDATEQTKALTPVRYSLDVGLSDGGLFATGSLAVDLELHCVSCLEPFVFPVRIDDFACQVELTGPETVDLTPLEREDILLALPPHPHCDWNGDKDCKGAFHPQSTESDTSSETRDVWGALDQLKIKKTN